MPIPFTLKKGVLSLFVLFGVCIKTHAQYMTTSSDNLVEILRGNDSLVDVVLDNMEKYRFQLIVSKVENRHEQNTFVIGQPRYFYPASLVKLPLALLALEKIEKLGLDLNHSIEVGEYEACNSDYFITLSKKNKLTFRQLFEELLIISDNHHYNTLFHFLTPKEINESLQKKGFLETFIYKSFEGCDISNQLKCAEIIIKNPKGDKVYVQKQNEMDTSIMQSNFAYSENRLIGKKRIKNRKIVKEPMDFNYTNDISLKDAHQMIRPLFLASSKDQETTWNIKAENKAFLLSCLQKFPREMEKSYHNDYKEIPDNKFKYFLIGELTDSIIEKRIFSKIAYSYGFTTETAYIPMEKESGLVLSMSIYTNENGILNDGKYEYTEIARPVFSRISNILCEYFKTH